MGRPRKVTVKSKVSLKDKLFTKLKKMFMKKAK
jgi:hypothetical protein